MLTLAKYYNLAYFGKIGNLCSNENKIFWILNNQ